MSATLYELADARDILDEFLAETEGEVTPELADLWDRLEGETNEKIERWGLWLQEQAGRVKAIREQEERLCARRKAIENAVERSKAALQANMERIGKEKVNGVLVTVSLQKNPPSVVMPDWSPEELEARYRSGFPFVRMVPATFALDRKTALERHKAGAPLPPGVEVVQTRSVRVR